MGGMGIFNMERRWWGDEKTFLNGEGAGEESTVR